ncbi:MAG TPA: endonuclease/exonuclease/phosphatase family protein [Elusimicrobiales bacterium]|nr:endonuclease/exonuclease/phosphatase family protein [Elusimicrobiales bacterium]
MPNLRIISCSLRPWKITLRLSALLLALALSGCRATAQEAVRPYVFRMMTYNIHHGEGLDRKVDLERIAALIKREKADIVALQEVDKGVPRTDYRDLTAELSALTGMTGVFSNNYNFQGGEYGNAMLTRFPVKRWTNLHYVMIRPGEQRGLLQLVLDAGGRELVVMNTHIDYRTDDEERMLNVGEIHRVAAQYGDVPMLISGDFNDLPGSRVHKKLAEVFDDVWETAGSGEGVTFPGDKHRIDYVWRARNAALSAIKAWTVQSDASDHLPLVVEFSFR